jgi:hypothetical protein
MRKPNTRQSKTEIGITLIGRTESGALYSDRRNELKKKSMASSNRAAAKTNRQERTLGSAK